MYNLNTSRTLFITKANYLGALACSDLTTGRYQARNVVFIMGLDNNEVIIHCIVHILATKATLPQDENLNTMRRKKQNHNFVLCESEYNICS